MPAAERLPKDFICSVCQRQFARLEHLQRHVRTHTKEKPFVCACGRRFARRDLLSRHQRLSRHDDVVDGQTAAEQSVNNFTDRGRETPSLEDKRQCTGSSSECLQSPAASTEMNAQRDESHDASTVSAHGFQETTRHAANQSEISRTSNLPGQRGGTSTHDTISTSALPSLDCLMSEDPLRDFSTFVGNVGLDIGWNELLRFEADNSDVCEPTGGISQTGVSGSNLTDQLNIPNHVTSMPYENQRPNVTSQSQAQPLAPDAQQDKQDHWDSLLTDSRHMQQPWRLTDDHRLRILTNLTSYAALLGDFALPSRQALTRYIKAYIDGFHPHFPFIHIATFRIQDCQPELALAIAAVGAQYCFETKPAILLFHASKAVALEQMARRTSSLQNMTHEQHVGSYSSLQIDIALRNPSSLIWPPDIHDHASRLQTVRAMLLLTSFSSWQDDTLLLRESFGFQSILARCIRENGLVEAATDPPDISWPEWIEAESARRTKMTVICLFSLQTIAYNLPPPILNDEIHLRLPCSTLEWNAENEAQWREARKSASGSSPLFQDAMAALLTTSDSLATQNFRSLSPYDNFITIHALLQRIFILRQLTSVDEASLNREETHKIEYVSFVPSLWMQLWDVESIHWADLFRNALRRWKALWQQAPESSLDPQNTEGPIPFSSAAFLSVAHIRLYMNFGPFRLLQTRNPALIAAALARIPPPERSPLLTSSLLHCAHALELPIALGINFVSQSQASFWSVQHAICSLECAVLLSKWLGVIASIPETDSLTLHEEQVLQWTRSSVQEAIHSLEPGGSCNVLVLDAGTLRIVVLKIWAKIFVGNTLWPVARRIGEALELYSAMV